MNGKYGPYITDGDVNANVPKGTDPQNVTLAEAVELLRIRAETGAQQKSRRRGCKPQGPAKQKKANGEAKLTKPAKVAKASQRKTKPATKPSARQERT
jgi:DNA topoisomerase-1